MTSGREKDARGQFKEILERTLAKDFGAAPRSELDTNAPAPAAEPACAEASGSASLKEMLLGDGPRFEALVPKRGRLRRRST